MLVTPIASSMVAFDATNEQVFTFTSSGGDQVVKNKITIRDNTTNAVVYTNTLETFSFQQTVPIGTLVNGTYYNYYFNTYNLEDDESSNSNVVSFYCYTSPIITVDNIPISNIINSSNYDFHATYNQTEGELLNYLVFNLYDGITDTLIETSDRFYSEDTPPIIFSHYISGFEDGGNYNLSVDAVSVNGTEVTSGEIALTVTYTNPEIFSSIDLTSRCEVGDVVVDSNIVLVDGIATPEPPTYVEGDTMVDLGKNGYNIIWTDGFSIPPSFINRIKFFPKDLGILSLLEKSGGGSIDMLYVVLVREVPYGETEIKSYFGLVGINGDGDTVILQKSNYITEINNKTEIFLWVKKVESTFELIAEVLSTETNQIFWNASSNVELSKITNIPIANTTAVVGEEFIPLADSMEGSFPMERYYINNGVYDHINVTECVTEIYNTIFPPWDYCTRFDCDFDGNINGGNTDLVLSQLAFLRVKRKKTTEFTWITLYEKTINEVEDLDLIYNDFYVPSGLGFDYAIVPVMNDGTEGDYITDSITPDFNHFTISDKDKTYTLYGEISFNSSRHKQVGKHITLGRKYPIMVSNGIEDYEDGTISGNLYGYDFYDTRKVDRYDVALEEEEFSDFWYNGNSKVIKDWNGRIRLVGADTTSTSKSFNMPNGYTNISLSWVEQGNYNDENDLRNNDLID